MYSLNVCKFTCVTFYGSQSLFMVYDSSIVIYHTKLSKWGEKVRLKFALYLCQQNVVSQRKLPDEVLKKSQILLLKSVF